MFGERDYMSFKNLFRKKYINSLFTTPSHSQKYCLVNKFKHFYKCDISETDTHNPQKYLDDAEEFASQIYGTNQTVFLTNGSTSGVISAVLACVRAGVNVLIWRESHICHKNGVELAGGNPIYYDIPICSDWGIPQKVTVELIEPYLIKNKIKAVIVTSPSYYGIVSDIKELKMLCEKYGAYLIVDEAHGALYPFSDRLPESAVKYADVVIQSLHKTVGGLNPTALIHSNLDFDIKPFVNKILTTSPSYPLLSTIEANISFLNSTRGRKKIDNLINSILKLRDECQNIDFGGDDITKILIKKNGLSGYELSDILYNQYHIEDEITNDKSTMLLCGIGTTDKKLKKLSESLKRIV